MFVGCVDRVGISVRGPDKTALKSSIERACGADDPVFAEGRTDEL